jgi:hypothetical protein
MRRRNYQRILGWLTPANVAGFYEAIDAHRRNRTSPVRSPASKERAKEVSHVAR